ncbi:MAG: MFS transporter [Gemmatimonadaceae bacterium]|nr:MFS transporter [Gemmatimonadaceae bacterium]
MDEDSRLNPMLKSLGLHRRELRAWAMYDWAASTAQTTIAVAVFPIFFTTVAGAGRPESEATSYWSLANAIGLAITTVLSPILGTISDYAAVKKRMLGMFMGVGVAACALMFLIQRGDLMLASILFIAANLGMQGSYVFYESLLPHVAKKEEMDRVSTAAYAIGYIGGGILLALNLAWISNPALFGLPVVRDLSLAGTLPSRLAFVSVAIWWLVFSIPLLRYVREPAVKLEADERPGDNPVKIAFVRLAETFRELRAYKQALLMLVAFLVYSDGIGTITRMATPYGTELGISRDSLIAAILLVQFVGIPFSFAFGALASRIGTKPAIFVGLVVYAMISIFGYFMRTATHFYILALLVGTVQGGTQALSRSLFASIIPPYKSGEFFGFFSVFSRFAGVLGSLLFYFIIGQSGSMRPAILAVISFFIVGGAILYFVDVEEGQRRAQEEEARAAALPGGDGAISVSSTY